VQSPGSRVEIIMYLIYLYSLFFVAKLRDIYKLSSQSFIKLALISKYSHITFIINSKVLEFFCIKLVEKIFKLSTAQ